MTEGSGSPVDEHACLDETRSFGTAACHAGENKDRSRQRAQKRAPHVTRHEVRPTLRISCEAVPPFIPPAGAQGGTSARRATLGARANRDFREADQASLRVLGNEHGERSQDAP
jgi:hypothetical protein